MNAILNNYALIVMLITLSSIPLSARLADTRSIDSIPFLEDNIEDIQRMASREGKAYFIHFTADWIMPCQWMEQETFTDPVLTALIKKAFLPVKADIDSPNGTSLKNQYEVKSLPTILVFSSRGQLLGSIEGALEAEELIDRLKPFDTPANRAVYSSDEPENLLTSPKAHVNISRPALLPEGIVQQATNLNSPQQDRPINNPPNNWRAPNYFTVQIGVFSDYENAIDHIQMLESNANRTAHFSQDKTGTKVLYRVYIGRLSDRTQAVKLQEMLKQQGINGFVKKINI